MNNSGYLARRGGKGAAAGLPRGETARDILDKRYARGEISAEEYRNMKEVLSGKEPSHKPPPREPGQG
ncbi:MAG: SHOCT domain-containing protein [Deltaproteobacteria bacterium]|nr:SHOCT domain-containing protein [Deltaproteobacteria bacterium]